jgi:EmrB/QacA subfamily drug resistance transporter
MAAADHHDPTTLGKRENVAAMAASVLGILLAALDQTVVATAGPTMQKDLHIAPSLYAWMTTSYVVASTVTVPLWGKLSDLFGRKRTLLLGMSLFLIGSALCAIAGSLRMLIVYRVIQGIGGAALFTNAFAITADLFAPADRGKYQGFFGAMFGVASVVGPYVGGFLTDAAGWEWVFLINLPIGAIALAVAIGLMPPLRRPRSEPIVVDVAGAALIVLAILPLLLALSLGHGDRPPELGPDGEPLPVIGWRWGSWQILALLATSVVGVIGVIAVERRAREPILDLRMFRRREFWLGCTAAFTAGLPFLAAIVYLPLFMTVVAGASATASGQALIPLTLGIVAANISSGQIVSRIGRYKPVLLASLGCSFVGFLVMGFTLTESSTELEVSLKMIVLGVGLGPAIPLYTLAIQSAVPMHQIGVATSTAVFARSVGATIGITIMSAVFAHALTSMPMGAVGPTAAAFTHATRFTFQICAVVVAVAALLTLALPAVPLRRQQLAPPPVE